MQDSIYHYLNRILLANFAPKHHDFAIRKRDVFMDVNAYNVTTLYANLIH